MHTPELSVVLLSYNRVDLTQRAVKQILGTTTGIDFDCSSSTTRPPMALVSIYTR